MENYKNKYLKMKNNLYGGMIPPPLIEPPPTSPVPRSVNTTSFQSNMEIAMKDVKTMEYSERHDLHNKFINLEGNVDVIFLKSNLKFISFDENYIYNAWSPSTDYNDPFDFDKNSYIFCFLKSELTKILDLINTTKDIRSINQILGLREEWGIYRFIICASIPKKDLFRPCWNNDILSKKCEIFKEPIIDKWDSLQKHNTKLRWLNDPKYNIWFEKFLKRSHYPHEKTNEVPFTGLGYTYNYKNSISESTIQSDPLSIVGLSEYVIRPGSKNIRIKGIIELNNNGTIKDINIYI